MGEGPMSNSSEHPDVMGIVLYGKEVNTHMAPAQADQFVNFLKVLRPKITVGTDQHGVSVRFDAKFVWYIPDNYDPEIPRVQSLGKADATLCTTIEQATFLCLAKWNETKPDKKIDVPHELISVAQKFIPGLKNPLSTKQRLAKFFGFAKQRGEQFNKTGSPDSSEAEPDPQESPNKPNKRY